MSVSKYSFREKHGIVLEHKKLKLKGKAIPLQAWTGPEGSGG
jgi:hypothetical protein